MASPQPMPEPQPLPQPVPKKIWQTWHSLPLPPAMTQAVNEVKAAHPDFTHTVMDDAACYAYIAQHFPSAVVTAFAMLIPGAFKADLWRLCVLYHDGGVYLDIKFKVVPPFTFHDLLDKTQFVVDRPAFSTRGFKPGIYNAFMVAVPRDPRILACIDNIVKNTQTRYYGWSPLEPTGPALVARHVSPRSPDVTMQYRTPPSLVRTDARSIYARSGELKQKYGGVRPLIECYNGYTSEQNKTQSRSPHYSRLYAERSVYVGDPGLSVINLSNQAIALSLCIVVLLILAAAGATMGMAAQEQAQLQFLGGGGLKRQRAINVKR